MGMPSQLFGNIWIVMPAYNEEASIGSVIASCRNEGYDNIIVVDDGSSDKTRSIAQQAGAFVVSHPINRGVGAATQTGLETARLFGASTVVTMDADGQHDPRDIQKLLEVLRTSRSDIVIGSRFLGGGNAIPLSRRLFNAVANMITLLLTGRYYSDSQSGLKAFSENALSKITITANGYEFSSEIFREARHFRLKVTETPVSVVYSDYSLTKGQHLAAGMSTVVKLMIRSVMR